MVSPRLSIEQFHTAHSEGGLVMDVKTLGIDLGKNVFLR